VVCFSLALSNTVDDFSASLQENNAFAESSLSFSSFSYFPCVLCALARVKNLYFSQSRQARQEELNTDFKINNY
jgi:hypothetical protein